jgi:beta-N-acetylhexosaminidase
LDSYTFEDLEALLNGAELETMEFEINRATWIVLVLSGASRGQPELVSRFLSERQDLLREKRIVLFAFTAPYYLDATDISKLSAYYGLYSKQPAFIDVAARLLYQELTPLGFSPVSIPGTGYDMIDITRPNPDQIITLSLDLPLNSVPTSSPTPPGLLATQTLEPTTAPEPTPIPLLGIGDTINVRTGVILDYNQHTVPDGTVVRFTMLLSGEGGGIIQQVDQVTTRGIARASFALEKPGLVEIRALSDPAIISETIQIDVSSGQAAPVTVVAPFPTETVTPTPVLPTPVEEDDFITPEGYPRFSGWILVIMFILFSALLAFWAGNRLLSSRWGWRWGICVLLGGLIGYNFIALNLLGSTQFVLENGLSAVLGISGVGELVGLGVAWIWSRQA